MYVVDIWFCGTALHYCSFAYLVAINGGKKDGCFISKQHNKRCHQIGFIIGQWCHVRTQDGVKSWRAFHISILYFCIYMIDFFVAVFTQCAAKSLNASKLLWHNKKKTQLFSLLCLAVYFVHLVRPPGTSHPRPFRAVCCSFSSWFGHWFLPEYISAWFKFSWEIHDPAAACRHCLDFTGLLGFFFFTPSKSQFAFCSLSPFELLCNLFLF